MAVYSLRYRYIFFANPQTASKAISRTLERELEGKLLHKEVPDEKKARLDKLHHLSFRQVVERALLPREELDRLVRVTGVRNPYDLLVSRYLKHRDRFTDEASRYPWVDRADKAGIRGSVAAAASRSFGEWLMVQYGDKKAARGMDKYLDHADCIIRFEAIQADFDALLRRLGVTWPVAVERENVTAQRETAGTGRPKLRYAEFYDDDSRELVDRLFEPVIQRFGYRFDA